MYKYCKLLLPYCLSFICLFSFLHCSIITNIFDNNSESLSNTIIQDTEDFILLNEIPSYKINQALVLCFHDILNTHKKGKYTITTDEFIKILDLLKNKYEVISLENWKSKGLYQKVKSSKPIVVLTFDDGYPSLIKTVIPLLKEYQYGATFYIYLNRYSDTSTFYKQLVKLPKQFEIGSHSFSHTFIKDDSPYKHKEIFLSKKKLEYLTDKEISSFAWPYGYYTDKNTMLVKTVGYKSQVSTDYHIASIDAPQSNYARFTVQKPHPVVRIEKILESYYLQFEKKKISKNS